jgi:hypothetical protein
MPTGRSPSRYGKVPQEGGHLVSRQTTEACHEGSTGICATAIVTAICAPGAYAGGRFDGAWTVVVTTTNGPCNDTYRFSGEIIDGVMHYSGSSLNNFSGRVGPSGSVSVRLSLGSKNAVATGRLTDKAGSGTWHGQAPEGPCAGTWEAERL